ncbi:hypothetical protein Tco_1569709 [Tanacetum coccineum]
MGRSGNHSLDSEDHMVIFGPTFKRNIRDLDSIGKKRDKTATLHKEAQKVHRVRGDGVAISSDGVRKFVTVSGLTDSKEALEDSTGDNVAIYKRRLRD